MPVKKRAAWRIRQCLAIALLAVLPAGCVQTYKAPERPASDLAVVVADTSELTIIAVDGQRTSVVRGTGRAQAAMLPGEHVIVVQHKRNGTVAEGSLLVDVQAGRRYVLKSASKRYRVAFWIEEASMDTGPVI